MKQAVVLSEKQLQAVQSAEDLVVVAAAAGSGKTRVLTEKIIHEVIENGVPLERIAAITYTNKAADEMRVRLMNGFKLRNRPQDARQVHRAQIMTIHSFALGLLKKYAIDAGLDPSFGIIEDIDYQLMLERAIDETLSDISRKDVQKALRLAEYAEYFQIKKSLKDAYEEWGTSRIQPHVAQINTDELDSHIVNFIQLLESGIKENDDGLIHADHVRSLQVESVEKKYEALTGLLGDIQSSRKRYLTPIKEECKALIALAADLNSIPVKHLLNELLVETDQRIAEMKQRLNRISINDQINKLLDVMDNVEVSEEIGQLFDWVMVDEFQDVNPAQYQLICQIARQCKKFFVGDVRQSIYGFRHADCSIFARLTGFEEALNQVIRLDENYRSHPDLISAVNDIYGMIPCFEEMSFGCVNSVQDHSVGESFISLQLCTQQVSSQDYRIAEAHHIARLIASQRVKSEKDMTHAILLRSMKHAFLYADALKLQGVSNRILGSGGFYECHEVMSVIHLFRWALNYEDVISLSAILKSDWLMLSEATISDMALHPKGLIEAVLLMPIENVCESDRNALIRLRQWHSKIKERLDQGTLVSFCEWSLMYFDIPTIVSAHTTGEIKLGNLNKLISMVRHYSEGAVSDLKSLIERFQILSESDEIREAEYDPLSEDKSVVQIMSIHKSKGLEFDAVYIPNKEARSKSDDGNVFYLNRQGEVVVSVASQRAQERIKTTSYQRHMEHLKKIQSEEKNRLYYVAMTRAKRELVISGNQPPVKQKREEKEPDPVAMLTLTGRLPELAREWTVEENTVSQKSHKEQSESSRAEIIRLALEPTRWMAPDSEIQWIQSTPRDYRSAIEMTTTQVAELWEDADVPYATGGGGIVSASDYGNVFHEAMQHYHFSAPGDREVDRLVREFGKKLDGESDKRLRDELTLFSTSRLLSELTEAEAEGRKVYREFSFVVRLSSGDNAENEAIFIKGQADLIWKSRSGNWRLVDYKSGQMHNSYVKQLEIYTYCLERVSAMKFEAAMLYFSKTSEMTEVALDEVRETDYLRLMFEKIRSDSGLMIQSMAKEG